MDANELRALQAPLKKQYREQPETGRTPARAEATFPSAKNDRRYAAVTSSAAPLLML